MSKKKQDNDSDIVELKPAKSSKPSQLRAGKARPDTDRYSNYILTLVIEDIQYEVNDYIDSIVIDVADKDGSLNATAFIYVITSISDKFGFNLWGKNQTFSFEDTRMSERIEELFKCYIKLCAEHKHTAQKIEFYTMLGVSKQLMSDWRTGNSHNVTHEASDFVTKLDQTFESILVSKTLDDMYPTGAIFNLKCQNGWVEAANRLQVNVSVDVPKLSVSQITQMAAQDEIIDGEWKDLE